MEPTVPEMDLSRKRRLTQVLHGCRQLVSSDVRLSPATSATHVLSCQHSVGHSRETAGDKPEEGVDDVKSSWPLRVGLHTCYNGGDNGLIPKSHLSSDWGLQLDPMKSESLVIA